MQLLENTTAITADQPADAADASNQHDDDHPVCCAACGHPVTRRRYRTTMGGHFRHTRVNPAGLLFQIGCFSDADGCRPAGPESDDFSWFAGYTWQVCVCHECRAHLGWRFWSTNQSFFGLILNRLT